ncbi:MAG: HIRAN domain-containing protein [Rhodocyclaceae bacterium]|nr:HIRAN domain-containing protein [Rhodocyclaceae bacterium]
MPTEASAGTLARRACALLLCLLWLATPGAALAQNLRMLVQSSPLAGFQFHAGPQLWNELKPGDALKLVREPDNAHDPNAVRVEWRGRKLGYLPRRENAIVAEQMDRGARVEARIARLTETADPWQRLLIDVMLVL